MENNFGENLLKTLNSSPFRINRNEIKKLIQAQTLPFINELRECADSVAVLDERMEEIKNKIKKT